MPTRYLVLRTDVPATAAFQFSSPTAWSKQTPGPTDLSVMIYDGHEPDAGNLRADPQNAAVMDADVALELIAPMSQAAASTAALKQVGAQKMTDGLVAVGAHTSPFTGQGVTVAILDTGIDDAHPAFQGKTIARKDFTGEGTSEKDVRDGHGHGTHCAATICGAPVGDVRVGVAPGVVKLCVGKVLGSNGGTLEMLIKGLIWAVIDQRASVVSMSLGYDLAGNAKRLVAKGYDVALATAQAMRLQNDISKGIGTLSAFLQSQMPNALFVAATGNESKRPSYVLDASLPAAEMFPVGAVGPVAGGDKWDVAPFSNGRALLVAPGVGVISAAPGGGWASMDGTSMATPHVAGVAALWTEKLRNAGLLAAPGSVVSALRTSAVRQPLVTSDLSSVGAGLVQAPQI